MGMPPTGKEITITFMNIDRFAGDKLVEHRAEVDMAGLMQQLGAIPSPATTWAKKSPSERDYEARWIGIVKSQS